MLSLAEQLFEPSEHPRFGLLYRFHNGSCRLGGSRGLWCRRYCRFGRFDLRQRLKVLAFGSDDHHFHAFDARALLETLEQFQRVDRCRSLKEHEHGGHFEFDAHEGVIDIVSRPTLEAKVGHPFRPFVAILGWGTGKQNTTAPRGSRRITFHDRRHGLILRTGKSGWQRLSINVT
jgi:hypothetical protein